uniref:E3 ubiquitin-protein ligase RFWD3-like WD40 domain-containing protein n=2 Tax=Dendroctonus ponderosae TaxID=77166 RepID=A0AAR5PC32_DENPD
MRLNGKMYIASASSTVKIHDFPNNQLLHTHVPTNQFDHACRSLSWAKDGNWLAVVPYSGCTEIVSVRGQCKLLHTVNKICEPSCASFPNLSKKTIAVGSKIGQVLIYDIKAKSIKGRFPRAGSAITHVGFTAKDTHCYAGCEDGKVMLYNSVAKNLSGTWKVPKSSSLTALKAHVERQNFLIGGSNEGIVGVWDVNFNKTKFHIDAHYAPVSAVLFSPVNAVLIVSAGLDRTVQVFDIEARCKISTIPVDNNVLSLDFLENSLYIAMGCQNGKILIYDTRQLQAPVHTYEAHSSSIKHLTYQKSASSSTSSTFLCSADVAEENRSPSNSASNEEIEVKATTSDFLGLVDEQSLLQSEILDASKQTNAGVKSGGDSFLKALGWVESDTIESAKEESKCLEQVDGNKELQHEPRRSINNFTPKPSRLPPRISAISKQNLDVLPTSSTPNLLKVSTNDCHSQISPIINGNQNPTNGNLSAASVSEMIDSARQTMQAEMKNMFEEVERKMIYKLYNHTCSIRQLMFDFQLENLKQFIKVKENFDVVIEEINSKAMSDESNMMAEQIYNLTMRNKELERQLAAYQRE